VTDFSVSQCTCLYLVTQYFFVALIKLLSFLENAAHRQYVSTV